MVGAFESVLDLGEVYQLEVTGAHETHPLHLHTNAFQIISLPAAVAAHRSGHFAVGDWHDTLVTPTVPTIGRSTDRILVRFVTDRFGGRVPLHCHGLNHADMGMMAVYQVRGAEGTSVQGCAVRGATAIGATSLTLTSVFVGVFVGVLVVCLALCLRRFRKHARFVDMSDAVRRRGRTCYHTTAPSCDRDAPDRKELPDPRELNPNSKALTT